MSESNSDVKRKVLKWKKELATFLISGIACVLILDPFEATEKDINAIVPRSLDSIIPNGFQLVPISISNASSLGSMVADDALVDLFEISKKGRPGKLLLRNVRLIRAPLQPEQYAALLQEHNTQTLLSAAGPYFATIKPYRKPTAGNFESLPKKKKIPQQKRSITYGDKND